MELEPKVTVFNVEQENELVQNLLSLESYIVLPPHCSNKMQPLDVAFMAPFKKNYSNAADIFLRQHPGVVVGLYDVADLMAQAFVKAASTSVAIAGFKAFGIWSCNRHVFPDESFAPEIQADMEPGTSSTRSTVNKSVEESVVETLLVYGQTPVDQASSAMDSSFNITPEEILPLPKVSGPRNSMRKRKTEKAVEITSDTYRQ